MNLWESRILLHGRWMKILGLVGRAYGEHWLTIMHSEEEITSIVTMNEIVLTSVRLTPETLVFICKSIDKREAMRFCANLSRYYSILLSSSFCLENLKNRGYTH